MKIQLFFIINLFTLFLSANEINLAKYRVVFQSSSADANHCGHLVVDGSLSTYWESLPGNNQWLTINLGGLHVIKKVIVYWGENYGTEYSVSLLTEVNSSGKVIFRGHNDTDLIKTIDCKDVKTTIVRIDIFKVKEAIRGCIIKEIKVIGYDDDERFVSPEPFQLSDLSLDGRFWRIQNALFVSDKPDIISRPGYNVREWIPANVPGTVLESYYNFGALPDPLYGDNMHQISDEFFSSSDFWYRTTVLLPYAVNNKHIFLDFSGINWKSEIYFNGQYIGRIDGAYLRGEFEITKLVDISGENVIAVLVHHPDNWVSGNHKVIKKYLGARTTNGDMLGFDSPACLASAGWNWEPIVKGRNIGIWNHVTFRITGNVSIHDPWASALLPLPDTTRADITIRTELKNESSTVIKGILRAKFGKINIELPVILNADETKTVLIDKNQFPQLALKNPKLWWPNGYGKQNLTNLSLQFIEKDNVSDIKTINVGIHQLDYKIEDNVLFFYCNGTRLLLRGGNWGLPEAMMNCDSTGYDLRVRLHKEANLNIIRNWVGQTDNEAFYDACDRYGILIWDDFWLANPGDGPDPKDTLMFMNNARDKIKRIRQHAALALYCGRNEGLPPLGLDISMKRETELLDGTRLYIPHSAAGIVTGNGPYDIQTPLWYFTNRGRTFHSELGIVAFPESESMHRMMPDKDLWPINDMWAIHDYQRPRSEYFTERIKTRFGEPTGVDDYCRRAQLLNYESAKSMFECLQSNQGSGVLLWMSQAAWPSLICQLYDHYFEYTASYFSAKKACEPIHVFWDMAKNEIRVANNTAKSLNDLTVKAKVFDLNGNKIWEKTIPVKIYPTSSIKCFVPEHFSDSKVNFIKLELANKENVISDNFYWTEDSLHRCIDLNSMPQANLDIKISCNEKESIKHATVQINNTSSHIALLVKLKVKNSKTGQSILPVFYNDNYVSILPGENKKLTFEFKSELAGNDTPQLWVEGYNTGIKKLDF